MAAIEWYIVAAIEWYIVAEFWWHIYVRDLTLIRQYQVFVGHAARGRSSTGWFYGFKVHLVCNERGELVNLALTPVNVDDRKPVPQLAQELFGKLFGDRSYVSQPLFVHLFETFDVQLITRLRKKYKEPVDPAGRPGPVA